MRSGNAAVCAAGREGNYIWSASRMIFGGVEENIPRPFGHRKRRARSRREYRNAESHERFEFDARPRPRCGANTGAGTIVSTPGTLRRLGARCGKWDKWRKNRTQHPFAREQKVVRRGRAGNARLHRPHGPYTRPTDRVDKIRRRAREIRDRTRWTRANIDVACRARLPGFQGKNRGECDRRVGRRTGVNLRASSPVWPVGSSTFARVLACRLKGVSRRVDWRAAVNRVFEARKEVVFELWRRRVSKNQNSRQKVDRVASGVQSTVVFLCLQKPKTEIHRTVLSQSIIRPIT